MKRRFTPVLFSLCAIANIACGQLDDVGSEREEKLASAIAEFIDIEWQGEVFTSNCFRPEVAIDEQLLYTVGQLNGFNSVGRLDQVQVKNVEAISTPTGCNITYEARMPVAWGRSGTPPEQVELLLPQDVSKDAVDTFVDQYTADCVDIHAHDVTPGVFWYYYRPNNFHCELAETDIFRFTAFSKPSENTTEGKYPEYHKVCEDYVLNFVAIFGFARDEYDSWDVGVNGYGKFVEAVRRELGDAATVEPTNGAVRPGRDQPVTVIKAQLEDGRTVVVNTFLIRSVTAASSEFWARYEALTPTADFIVYNGHSGLGQNVRKLARRGEWRPGQYSIVFMNGCDTYAYIDSALADAHAAVNPDDPEGTKYLDIVANAMPSLFRSMPAATMAIIRGLLSYDDPMTYEEILKNIDSYEVALVTGEHDNEFEPAR